MHNNQEEILILNPIRFKEILIKEENHHLLNTININDFFIHAYHEDEIKLKMPLPPHRKTVNDFTLIIEGELTRSIGVQNFQIKAGELLYTPQLQITSTQKSEKPIKGYYVHFSPHFLQHHQLLMQWHTQAIAQNHIKIPKKQIGVLVQLLDRINYLYKSKREDAMQLIPYYLSTFIAEISSNLEKDIHKKTKALTDQFIQLIYKNFKTIKNIKDYATRLHISPNHLNKTIKKDTGKSASQILIEVTILEAKVLLHQSDLSISEIAYALGFTDTSYFSRHFKTNTGKNPSEYRNLIDLS